MSAPTTIEMRDEIRLFLPGISDEEHAKRVRLRSLRNAATAMIARTDSGAARSLAWMASDYATGALYSTGSTGTLDDLNRLCTRLLKTAMLAEEIDEERLGV